MPLVSLTAPAIMGPIVIPTPYTAWKNPIAVDLFSFGMPVIDPDMQTEKTAPYAKPHIACRKYSGKSCVHW